jgi:1-deoxy-D-xylulose-5-phosphate reductoisomerase
MQRTLSILGSTGSVGTSTVDLVASAPGQFKVKALTAFRNADLLIKQAKQLNPEMVAIADESLYQQVKSGLPGIKVVSGTAGVEEAAATQVDVAMAAIVGMAGLKPVLNAIHNAKAVAIANKEPLVSAGTFLLAEAEKRGTKILPVDSEHNAIFQVFEEENRKSITRIILTASGGPFRTWTQEQIDAATPEQAIAHPNWTMGAKISVDSASMMNKGLEVIEAHHLFAMPADKIDVLLHPQSVIHSMVEYCDGSVLAQLGAPDMRTPIAYALAYPNRMQTTGQRLDLTKLSQLDFGSPDLNKFPCLAMAYEALRAGPASCIALNAANEVAVEAFLNRKIGFGDIARLVRAILDADHPGTVGDLNEIMAYDLAIKEKTCALINQALVAPC